MINQVSIPAMAVVFLNTTVSWYGGDKASLQHNELSVTHFTDSVDVASKAFPFSSDDVQAEACKGNKICSLKPFYPINLIKSCIDNPIPNFKLTHFS